MLDVCTWRRRAVTRLVCSFVALSLSVVSAASAQTVPTPWTAADVGRPAVAGSADSSDGRTFRVTAAGDDIWGASDQFHFVYQPVDGDVEVIARVDAVAYAHAWSKAGVMVRSSLAADAAHGYVLVSAGKGVAFQRRTASGGSSTHTFGGSATAPYWVRVLRMGNQVSAYASPDGANWTLIATDTIALAQRAWVGLAVTSHSRSNPTSATVAQVSVRPLGLPAPFNSADLGTPALRGGARFSGGTFTVEAAGVDIWDAADEGHYVYQPITGDVDIRARVGAIQYQHRWSKAGVMVRESLAANARHAYALASAGAGYAFQRRVDTGGLSTHTAGGSGTPPGWVRLVRSGDQFTAYRSNDGTNWTTMGSDIIPMGSTAYVGLAVTSHNAAALTGAVIDSVSISQATPPQNQPPSVTLTSPANGATYAAPATLTLSASAADPEGRMAKVDFFANGALVGSDTTAPFGISWSSVPAGSYAVQAVAHDADGASATSQSVSIAVGASGSQRVAFTASADHSIVTKYVLEVFTSGANPASATPLAVSDLGKPAPDASGEIVVDRDAFLSALAPGTYTVTVAAHGNGGPSRSAPISFTR